MIELRINRNSLDSPIRECIIEGMRLPYDVCSNFSLGYAQSVYPKFTYIGSSYIYYINGAKNISKTLHHFFKKYNP